MLNYNTLIIFMATECCGCIPQITLWVVNFIFIFYINVLYYYNSIANGHPIGEINQINSMLNRDVYKFKLYYFIPPITFKTLVVEGMSSLDVDGFGLALLKLIKTELKLKCLKPIV